MDTQLNAPSTLPVRARTVSGCLNSAFSRHFYTFYGSSVQSMGIQLNALPALPVRARTVSGCLSSALLGLERNRPAVVTSQFLGEPASALLCSCFATESLAQTAPLSRATNLHIKANRVPPCGFVQEPVPERPQTLAVKPSSAQGPSGTGFFLFSAKRPFSTGEKLVLYKLVRAVVS